MESIPAPTVRWGEWISEGWQMFAVRWQVWVAQGLIFFAIWVVPILSLYFIFLVSAIVETRAGQDQSPPLISIGIILLAFPILYLLSVFLLSGMWRTATKQLRGGEISVRDLFSAGDVFLRLLGATILLTFLSFFGTLFFIIPGFIVLGLFQFTIPLIIDRGMSVGSAMNASFNATKEHWFIYTLFAIVVSLLASVGGILCYVGVLATYPLHFTISAIAYRDTFGIDGAVRFTPIAGSTATSYAGQSWPVSPQPATTPPAPPRPLFTQTAESPEQAKVHCHQCGTAIIRAAKFCNICGSALQI
jgi:hypothetical protein